MSDETASPRTNPRDDDRDLRRAMAGAVWVAPSTALALLDRAQKAEAALQEAPAPEGLRFAYRLATALHAIVGCGNLPKGCEETARLVTAALAAAPSAPAEPPNPERWHPPVGPDDVTPCHCGKFGHLPRPPEPCPDHDPNSGPGSDQCPNCGRYAEPPRTRRIEAFREDMNRLRAAQETPAPEGLARALWAASRDPVAEYGEMKHADRHAGRIIAALAATPPAEPPRPYSLWDTESSNIIGAFPDLNALVRFAYAYGQANPDSTKFPSTDLYARADGWPSEGLDATVRCRDLAYDAHNWDSTGSPSFCRDCGLSFPRFHRLSAGGPKA